jgi:hypothetical protein
MSSPVFQALVNARMHEANGAEAGFRTFVLQELGNPPVGVGAPPEFAFWAESKGVPAKPASPASVAAFVLEQKTMKPGLLVEIICKISEAHAGAGLSDPTAAWPVSEALSRVTEIKAPRSWPSSEKTLWQMLPEPLRKYLSIREFDRERVIRNKMNEIAEAKKQLLKEITPHGTVEEQPAEKHVDA